MSLTTRWAAAALLKFGMVCALVGAVALGEEAQPPAPDFATVGSGVAFEKVVFRVEKVGRFGGRADRRRGSMSLDGEAIVFQGRRDRVTLPLDEIELVHTGVLGGDVDTRWIVIKRRTAEGFRVYGVRDGSKLGYGQKTPQIGQAVLDALRARKLAQFEAPDGWESFSDLPGRLTLAVPRGWTHDTLDSGSDLGGELPAIRTAVDIRRGEFAFIAPDRRQEALVMFRPSPGGVRCERIGERGARSLLERVTRWAEQSGQTWELEDRQEATISHCQANELRYEVTGHELSALRVRAVSNDGMLYLIGMRGASQEALEPAFRTLVESVRLPVEP